MQLFSLFFAISACFWHEIVPCATSFTNDRCVKCQEGYVQPDLILMSSNDSSSTSCFTPLSQCLPGDITYRRTKDDNAFCNRMSGCKCDTSKCYYGDPCLCSMRKPCGANQTLTQNGSCVPCPPNTHKDVGCSPCRHIGLFIESIHMVTTGEPSTKPSFSSSSPHQSSSLPSTTSTTSSTSAISSLSLSSLSSLEQTNNESKRRNNTLFVIIAGVLSLIAIILLIFILAFLIRRPSGRLHLFSSTFWSHDPSSANEYNHISERERLTPENDEQARGSTGENPNIKLDLGSKTGQYNKKQESHHETSKQDFFNTSSLSQESGYCEDLNDLENNLKGAEFYHSKQQPMEWVLEICGEGLELDIKTKIASSFDSTAREHCTIDEEYHKTGGLRESEEHITESSFHKNSDQGNGPLIVSTNDLEDVHEVCNHHVLYRVSSQNNPVSQETEDHSLGLNHEKDDNVRLDTFISEDQETINRIPTASGIIASMNVSDVQSEQPTIDSDVGVFPFILKEETKHDFNPTSLSQTRPKEQGNGPDSIDSGVNV